MTKRSIGRRFALLALAAFAAGCGGNSTTAPEFDASLGIDLASMTKSGSGLYWQDLTVGSGAVAKTGDEATVAYTGWLSSGQRFDSGTFSFTVGVGQVIAGFDEGIMGMKVGGKRKLVIPPELGYGNRGVGSIPPNSTLVFDVELLGIK